MRFYRLKAQITVLASLTIILVLAVVCTSIKSASDAAVNVKLGMAANLAVESVFAGYTRQIADRFNILIMPDRQSLEADITSYAGKSCENNGRFGGAQALACDITAKTYPTDEGGSVFASAVASYMQYGVFSEFADMLMGSEKRIRAEYRTGELAEEIAQCREDIAAIDSVLLELIAQVEGIDSAGGYFKSENDGPAATGQGFVKTAAPDEPSPSLMGVSDLRVYNVMKPHYSNLSAILSDIQDDAYELDNLDDDASPQKERWLKASVSGSISELEDAVDSAKAACERGIELCNMYRKSKDSVVKKAKTAQGHIDESRNLIGKEVADILYEDAGKIGQFATDDAICDAEAVYSALRDILPYFMLLSQRTQDISNAYRDGSYGEVQNRTHDARMTAQAIRYSGLKFNYSGVVFKKNKADKGMFQRVRDVMSKGMMGIVLEDGAEVSEKQITFSDLADSAVSYDRSHLDGVLTQIKNTILYDEYVMMHFDSYTDYITNDRGGGTNTENSSVSGDEGELLDYQAEYILNGCRTDYDNLFMTVLKLSALREGTNFVCLMTDSARRQECYALALAMFGFTGMPAVVTAAEYVIMALWAYAEALSDVRQLMAGDKVELAKTSATWKLSLEGAAACDFGKKDSDRSDSGSSKGLDYEEYLRILLMMCQRNQKYYRTMAQIELWAVRRGCQEFRMRNHICGMDAYISFKAGAYRNSRYSVQSVSYGY